MEVGRKRPWNEITVAAVAKRYLYVDINDFWCRILMNQSNAATEPITRPKSKMIHDIFENFEPELFSQRMRKLEVRSWLPRLMFADFVEALYEPVVDVKAPVTPVAEPVVEPSKSVA